VHALLGFEAQPFLFLQNEKNEDPEDDQRDEPAANEIPQETIGIPIGIHGSPPCLTAKQPPLQE